ncbi:MAG: DNA polymerase III subunit alpha [Granulicatella adiacens]|nr:DNA polymerase III subunit alpha [Granulicatella adiacens]
MPFTTLQVFSSYSLLKSTIRLNEYVETGKLLGYKQLALTDDGVLHGAVEFYERCIQNGIQPILGCTFEVAWKSDASRKEMLVVYAKGAKGYESLLKLSTLYQQGITWTKEMTKWIATHSEDVKIVLPPMDSEWVAAHSKGRLEAVLGAVKEEYAGVEIAVGITREMVDRCEFDTMREGIEAAGVIPVAFSVSRYLNTTDYFPWKVLQAIRLGETLSFTQEDATGSESLPEATSMTKVFQAAIGGILLTNLEQFTKDLVVEIPLRDTMLPQFPVPGGKTSAQFLYELCEAAMLEMGVTTPIYVNRLKEELAVIHEMGFDDYFLIVWDIMRHAREKGIQTGAGRGSAAGSLVAYLLHITGVDPIRYNLLFERFLNRERYTMPDIDLDFPDDKREDILAYIVSKYGNQNVAQIVTFGTLGAKQVIRDVCKVFGENIITVQKFSNNIAQGKVTLEQTYKENKTFREHVESSERNRKLYQVAKALEGLPRHSSVHAAGVVLSQDALTKTVPLMKRDKGYSATIQEADWMLTQYAMQAVEKVGLLKMDLLGLSNLTLLHKAIQQTQKITKKAIDITKIPLDDPRTFELFQKAQTNGIFQFESDGIRRVLKDMQPTAFEDLVAVLALYRPGPMEQIPHFINRKKGTEIVQYPHTSLKKILEPTYGILVYQEQVMQAASEMAGFTLGEADILRRAIGKKNSDAIAAQKEKFVQGALTKGYKQEDAETVYDYIEKFANYGFNKSHAVAYAMLSYQLAYLKANYPTAFFTALFQNASAKSAKLQDYLVEARQLGIKILPPSINRSYADFVADDSGVIVGLNNIKGIRRDFVESIVKNRYEYGPFKGFQDFAYRMGAQYTKEPLLLALINAGAFDEFGETRATLKANVDAVAKSVKFHGLNLSLEDDLEVAFTHVEEEPLLQRIEEEIEVLGFSVSPHPSSKYDPLVKSRWITPIQTVFEEGYIRFVGMIVDIRKISTRKGEQMAYVTLQDASGMMDVVVFPSTLAEVYQHLQQNTMVLAEGRVKRGQKGQWQLQLNRMYPMSFADKLLEDSSKRLQIAIRPEKHTPEVYAEIKQLVTKFKGVTPVELFLVNSKTLVKNSFANGVNLESKLIPGLIDILDKECIKIVK